MARTPPLGANIGRELNAVVRENPILIGIFGLYLYGAPLDLWQLRQGAREGMYQWLERPFQIA